ncbi:MAG: MarC family protein [Rhodobacteraceae bacterium]|jgi:multiple antibiotic resistance protein|nr:MarC family protein [Rhodobacterales bacterium]NCX70514.1 MarC family protein [Paracoccaceae bacterium]
MEFEFLLTSFVALFIIIDPIGLTPVFIAITQGMDDTLRRKVALRSVLVSAFVISLFIVGGETVLGFIGISMPAFRIAGGILLFLTALDMLFQRRSKRRENQTEQELVDDPSVFPLAIPLIIGPGAIATVILIAGAKPGLVGVASTGFITALVLVTVFVFFSAASRIEKLLGKTGIDVLTRLLGMLLAALSVQFVIEGLIEFFPQ